LTGLDVQLPGNAAGLARLWRSMRRSLASGGSFDIGVPGSGRCPCSPRSGTRCLSDGVEGERGSSRSRKGGARIPGSSPNIGWRARRPAPTSPPMPKISPGAPQRRRPPQPRPGVVALFQLSRSPRSRPRLKEVPGGRHLHDKPMVTFTSGWPPSSRP
jgi:hypothetical protein